MPGTERDCVGRLPRASNWKSVMRCRPPPDGVVQPAGRTRRGSRIDDNDLVQARAGGEVEAEPGAETPFVHFPHQVAIDVEVFEHSRGDARSRSRAAAEMTGQVVVFCCTAIATVPGQNVYE